MSTSKPSQILLDANFLLIPSQMHLDIYKQLELNFPKPYKLIILSAIFIELEKKIRNFPRKNKFKQEYKLSREILEQQEYSLINLERQPNQLVDDLLLDYAIKSRERGDNVYIATNDRELRKKCRENNIKVIFVRQRKYLEIE